MWKDHGDHQTESQTVTGIEGRSHGVSGIEGRSQVPVLNVFNERMEHVKLKGVAGRISFTNKQRGRSKISWRDILHMYHMCQMTH